MIRLKQLLAEIISNTDLGLDIHYLVENRDRLEGNLYQILVHLCKIFYVDDIEQQKYWINNDLKKHIRLVYDNKTYNPKKKGEYDKYMYVFSKLRSAKFDAKNEYEKGLQINPMPFNKFSKEIDDVIFDKFKLLINLLIAPNKSNFNLEDEVFDNESKKLQTIILSNYDKK
jgi:hypothetical protein